MLVRRMMLVNSGGAAESPWPLAVGLLAQDRVAVRQQATGLFESPLSEQAGHVWLDVLKPLRWAAVSRDLA